ncbi:MAG: inositol monophosphatase family protein, partial [Candidatus Bathyarchaeia archaeon]
AQGMFLAKSLLKNSRSAIVRRPTIQSQNSWMQILTKCKENVQRKISPLMTKKKQAQPSLGIGAGGDPIKKIDLAAEKAIADTLRKQGISFTLISEESGFKEYGKAPDRCYVTVDPIDGSTNLTRQIPFYATSIAVSPKPTLETVYAALVADLCRNAVYTAQRNQGAYCNGIKIRPSKNVSLEDAVIGVDINTFKINELIGSFSNLAKKTKHIRHLGANALELCYVADGKSDAFVDIRGKLRTTDVAAAYLVIKESGAKMTNINGKPLKARLDPKRTVSFVAAANMAMHKNVLSLVRREKEKR